MVDRRDPVVRIVNAIHRNVFIATEGRYARRLAGMESVLLTTTGRKSGLKRQSMLSAPIVEDDRIVLIASWGGGPRNPEWYYNLTANPNVQVMLRGAIRNMVARVAEDTERDELWPRVTAAYRGYANYQTNTDRKFPVVILTPA